MADLKKYRYIKFSKIVTSRKFSDTDEDDIHHCLRCRYTGDDWAEHDDFINEDESNERLCPKCHSQAYFIATDEEKELGKPAEKKPMTIDEFSSKVSALSAIARDFRSDEWDEAEKLSGETIDNADNLEWDAVTCYLDELEEHLGNMKKDKEN